MLRLEIMAQGENASTEKSIICLGCARVVPPEVDFCPHCGAPLSPTSTTDPYKSVFAEGQMYWRLTHAPMKPIVMVGFGLLLVAIVPVMMFMLWSEITDDSHSFLQRILEALGPMIGMGLSGVLAIKVIQNFRKHRNSGRDQYKNK